MLAVISMYILYSVMHGRTDSICGDGNDGGCDRKFIVPEDGVRGDR